MRRQRRLACGRWMVYRALVLVTLTALGPPVSAAAIETHTVQAGDTLESLAVAHGVSPEDLAAANGLDLWSPVYEGQELIIPREGKGDGQEGGPAVMIDGILPYKQSRSLSCEFASLSIATSVFGAPIPEDEAIALTTWSDNPHFGFRGNIDGPWGVTDDYGIYAEALVPILEVHGFAGEVAYVPDAGYLQAQLDAGHPTIVWIATRGDTGFYETDADGNVFKLVPYEHVVVAYGYDDWGVYIADPGPGVLSYLEWDSFLDAWAVLDGMSLAVYPA